VSTIGRRARRPSFVDPAAITRFAEERERTRLAARGDATAAASAEVHRADAALGNAEPDDLAAARARAVAARLRRLRFAAAAHGADLRGSISLAGRLSAFGRSLAEAPDGLARPDELTAVLTIREAHKRS